MAQTLHRGGNHMNHPTRLGTETQDAGIPLCLAQRSIPMRLGNNNVTHFVLFDKWGKP